MGREALKGSGPKMKARDWRKYRDRCPSVKTMGWGWRSFEASLLIILLQHIGWRKQHIPKSPLTVQVNTKCTHLSILSENIFYRGLIKGKSHPIIKAMAMPARNLMLLEASKEWWRKEWRKEWWKKEWWRKEWWWKEWWRKSEGRAPED